MKLISFTDAITRKHSKVAINLESIIAVIEYEPSETTIIFGSGDEDYVRIHEPFDKVMAAISEAMNDV
jgi:hypothetical protein